MNSPTNFAGEKRMEARHTALPWRGRNAQSSIEIIGANGERIAELWINESTVANLAFIVRACNTHDDLVAALRGLLKAGHGLHSGSIEWNAVHAALAKATGAA